jgi:hypothetical protein
MMDMNRRQALQLSALGVFSSLLGRRQAMAAPAAKAQSVIQIFLPGGMASQESFDPKPLAPIEYRGELSAIGTRLPGYQISSLLPRTAGVADKLVICRAMTHSEADHDRGVHNMLTGMRPSPAVVYPSLGSVLAHRLGSRKRLPPYICVPSQPNNFAGSGYLPASCAPFSLGSDPARGDFRVRDLDRPSGIDDSRSARRRELLGLVNEDFEARAGGDATLAVERFYEDAYALIDSKDARAAFDINAEPAKLRDAYGRHDAGQRMLMARRLVEAGARFVTLTYGGWDMHDRIAQGMRNLMPRFDQAFAALISDLDSRGLLDSTLVLVTTEFGRTPKLNRTGGRDHWPKVFSIAMAGGGLKRGLVYGSTDATATEPEEDPLTVEDWAATVLHLIGIDPRTMLMAPGDRPLAIIKDGSPRTALIA